MTVAPAKLARGAGRLALAYAGALVLFGAFVMTKGANPIDVPAVLPGRLPPVAP